MNVLKRDKQVAVVSMLCEGCSIRSVERITGVHRDTIMRLLVRVGEHCARILDEKLRGVHSTSIQADEIWAFVGKKQKQLRPGDPADFGDQFVFLAMDADSKVVLSHTVGKRNTATAIQLMRDLSSRVVGRVQLSTDGFNGYRIAVPHAFNGRADYMQVVKHYAAPTDGKHRYSPPTVVSITRLWVQGFPRQDRISTSYVERQNLTIRMQLRRLTRLTNAFSKKLANLKAALNLHFAWYNFVRIHKTLRMTPAMAAGVVDTLWSIEDLIPAN